MEVQGGVIEGDPDHLTDLTTCARLVTYRGFGGDEEFAQLAVTGERCPARRPQSQPSGTWYVARLTTMDGR